MSKFRCVCGHVISTSGAIPNPDEWLYIADTDFEGFEGALDAEVLYRRLGRAYLCPVSGHLWVFRSPDDATPVGFGRLDPSERQDAT